MRLLDVIFAPARCFLNTLFSAHVRVDGDSMSPSLEHRQSVLVVRPVFPWNRLRRGDVVVLNPPGPAVGVAEGTWFIKRLAAMPDEEIVLVDGRLYADDMLLADLSAGSDRAVGEATGVRREWWNGPDEYFVLGDNPADSRDSRAFGPVPYERIIGRVWLRVWPPGSWGPV